MTKVTKKDIDNGHPIIYPCRMNDNSLVKMCRYCGKVIDDKKKYFFCSDKCRNKETQLTYLLKDKQKVQQALIQSI